MPELIGLCDRILVLHEGSIAGEVEGETMTEEEIMKLASGLGGQNGSPAKRGGRHDDGQGTEIRNQIKN